MTAPDSDTPERIRLVVLFGGRSAEHDVSCVSARHVLAAVDTDRYKVEPIGITRDGRWVFAEAARTALEDGADAMPDRLEAVGPEVQPLPTLADSGAAPTVVLPVLHGPMGEDGTVQGLLELAGVPYVGAGVLASALCMDKVACKDHLAGHGLPQCAYRWITIDDGIVRRPDGSRVHLLTEVDAAINELGLPMFVKPANMGSSVGVSRATTADEVAAAIELAATYDREVILEEEVIGREIEIAVLGNEDPEASVAGEIVPGADFYDYADKYDDGADLLIPAPLTSDELAELQRLAIAPAPQRDQYHAIGVHADLDAAGQRSRHASLIDRCGAGAPTPRPSRSTHSHRPLANGRFFLRGWVPQHRPLPRLVDQRDQHHAGVHADLDVSEDVAGQRSRLCVVD